MDDPLVIDARGLLCPLPVLRLQKALRARADVVLIADDPMAAIDVPHFCAAGGHDLTLEDAGRFRVRRAPLAGLAAGAIDGAEAEGSVPDRSPTHERPRRP